VNAPAAAGTPIDALALAREACEQEIGDHQAENPIAEKLQALVATPATIAPGSAAVSQRLRQQHPISEGVAEPGLDRLRSIRHGE